MDLNKFIDSIVVLNPSEVHINKVMAKYKLEYMLPSIVKVLNKRLRKDEEDNQNRLLSPYNLSEEVVNGIEDKYRIKINQKKINNKIIAGYKIYTKDKVIDNTLNNIIRLIK